jgi:hypothetical protein
MEDQTRTLGWRRSRSRAEQSGAEQSKAGAEEQKKKRQQRKHADRPTEQSGWGKA